MSQHSTPYTALLDEILLAEFKTLDESITNDAKYLDWVVENDPDSGFIDGLRHDLDHQCADYQWMQKELFHRGFLYNTDTKNWEK